MIKIAYLTVSKSHRKYNHLVHRALEAAGIKYTKVSTKFGYSLMVDQKDVDKASICVLSVPFK